MNNNKPEFAEIKGKKYKINTDFRIAIECDNIAKDETTGEYEKVLAIIYKLFGNEGLDDPQNYDKLLELGMKFLSCGQEFEEKNNQKVNMDYEQDLGLIEASFRSDYGIDLDKEEMHWWTYFNLMNGLTENCVLNRVRGVRDFDINDIKDPKEKAKMIDLKKSVELKKEIKINEKEQESVRKFYELTGIKK